MTKTSTYEVAAQSDPEPEHILLIGTQIGKCDICKETKKILLLKYGFNLCENCLNVCTSILERLENQTKTPDNKKEV
ncbi:MAG: hypothetical protein NWE92_09300 [Candidatus Bathyarchaeota archaeon]|nr:hypothetical protein [Candidatus Bathyarchaeota archaeon]